MVEAESIRITDPETAQSFVDAIELSEIASKTTPMSDIAFRIATSDDIIKLLELRRRNKDCKEKNHI